MTFLKVFGISAQTTHACWQPLYRPFWLYTECNVTVTLTVGWEWLSCERLRIDRNVIQ